MADIVFKYHLNKYREQFSNKGKLHKFMENNKYFC